MDRVDRSRALPSIASLIRYHIGVIALSVGVTLGLGTLYIVNSPSTYTATAVILLSPTPGNPLTAESASGSAVQMTVALETEARLLRTPAVAELVSDEVGRSVPDSGERLAVSVPSNSQMLEVTFVSDSAVRAQEGAQAFAEGYLTYRAERARVVQDAQVQRLREQVAETDANLRRAVGEAADNASRYASQEVQIFSDRLAQLSNSLSAAEAVSTSPGSVISSAMLPERSNQLPAWVVLAAAAAVGLLGGMGWALLREWRHDLLRDSDITDGLGLPVLATLPLADRAALAVDAGMEVHEAYRQLRTAVIAHRTRSHTLAVTAVDSARSAEVAVNLAMVLAEARFSVLLVVATDTQEARIDGLLGLDAQAGLAEAVLDRASVQELLVWTDGIAVLPAGRERARSRDLTTSSAFRELVAELHQEFDYVILVAADAGSAEGDAVSLAAGAALLVLTPNVTTRALLEATLDRFDRLGVDTIGGVKVLPSKSASMVDSPPPVRPRRVSHAIVDSTSEHHAIN